jgi:hypothetical protein
MDAVAAAAKLRKLPHQLLGYKGADGYPVALPVEVEDAGRGGFRVIASSLPPGGRRAGILAHEYRAKLIGLAARQHTGWLEDGLYAPHTTSAFVAPPNKTLLLLANGYMARRGLKKARAQQGA